uniref:Uncharacterized protein n=1 Tax=Cuerna arida TaxID=1464854 RepID=A0A1B6F1Y9_9HEMI
MSVWLENKKIYELEHWEVQIILFSTIMIRGSKTDFGSFHQSVALVAIKLSCVQIVRLCLMSVWLENGLVSMKNNSAIVSTENKAVEESSTMTFLNNTTEGGSSPMIFLANTSAKENQPIAFLVLNTRYFESWNNSSTVLFGLNDTSFEAGKLFSGYFMNLEGLSSAEYEIIENSASTKTEVITANYSTTVLCFFITVYGIMVIIALLLKKPDVLKFVSFYTTPITFILVLKSIEGVTMSSNSSVIFTTGLCAFWVISLSLTAAFLYDLADELEEKEKLKFAQMYLNEFGTIIFCNHCLSCSADLTTIARGI